MSKWQDFKKVCKEQPLGTLRRSVCLPFVMLFIGLACVFTALGFGMYDAKQIWNDLF